MAKTAITLDHVRRRTKAGVAALGIDAYSTVGGWVWDATDSTTLRTGCAHWPRAVDAWRDGLYRLARSGRPITDEARRELERLGWAL